MKAAAVQWNRSSENIKEAWGRRAEFLNSLPVVGRLNNIPGSRIFLENNIISAMYLDWKNLVRKMHSSIKNKGRNDKDIVKIYKFGKEEVAIQSQTYRKLLLSTLLRFELFGKEYEKVTEYVVMRSKKRVLLHLPSSSATKRIFTIIADLCGFDVQLENNMNVTCCGKVTI